MEILLFLKEMIFVYIVNVWVARLKNVLQQVVQSQLAKTTKLYLANVVRTHVLQVSLEWPLYFSQYLEIFFGFRLAYNRLIAFQVALTSVVLRTTLVMSTKIRLTINGLQLTKTGQSFSLVSMVNNATTYRYTYLKNQAIRTGYVPFH